METISADVVVVGAGPAGMAATAAAVERGASVVVLEAGNRIGGNAITSTGYLAFVHDDREGFYADALRAFEAAARRYALVWDAAAIRQFAAESGETHRDLTSRGVRFSRIVTRPEHSVDRIYAVEDPAMFARAYAADFENPRVRTMFGVRVDRLHTENGRVTAVTAHRLDDDTRFTVRARHGVVLASGGYQAGHALRRRYQPGGAAESAYFGTSNCRGDGHVIGTAVGGDLVNMSYLPPMILAPSTVAENAVAVNAAGARFHDETGPFEDRVTMLRRQKQGRGWYILDAFGVRAQARLIAQMPQPPVTGRTIDQLAAAIDVPAERLTATVDRWNGFLASDAATDPEFGRTALPRCRRGLKEGPFTAVPMAEGVNFSCGGFRTTARMQVIDVFGTPIMGLYAAGDAAAGLNAAAGMTGLHISGAFTQGRIAGRSAADPDSDTTGYGSVLTASMVVDVAEAITAFTAH